MAVSGSAGLIAHRPHGEEVFDNAPLRRSVGFRCT